MGKINQHFIMGRKVKVILQPVKFRKHLHVAVLCLSNPDLDEIIREFEDSEWSTGYRFWHIPLKKDTLRILINALKRNFIVDSSAFKDFQFKNESIEEQKVRRKIKTELPSSEQLKKIQNIEKVFIENGYSEGTAKVYCSLIKVFFGWFNGKREEDLTKEDILQHINKYVEQHSLTPNYRRLMLNAVGRYFKYSGRNDLSKLQL